ncbi:uncharacterized protein [Miscanthus floridulus]|uniref:uncharacterized protein isoform X2 n=1 Tax=Miscanthus floridulus TaxID=154761 RepID=UPI003457D400
MSSRNRSAASSCVAPAAEPSLRTPRRLRRRPVKAPTGAPCGGRRSGPATPLLKWDVGGGHGEGRKGAGAADEARDAARDTKAREVSVRRLVAGIWRLRPPEAVARGGGGGCKGRVRVGVEAAINVGITNLILETDAKLVQQAVNHGDYRASLAGSLWRN